MGSKNRAAKQESQNAFRLKNDFLFYSTNLLGDKLFSAMFLFEMPKQDLLRLSSSLIMCQTFHLTPEIFCSHTHTLSIDLIVHFPNICRTFIIIILPVRRLVDLALNHLLHISRSHERNPCSHMPAHTHLHTHKKWTKASSVSPYGGGSLLQTVNLPKWQEAVCVGEYCYEEKDTRICLLALRKGNKEKECLEDPSLGRKKMRPVGVADLSC